MALVEPSSFSAKVSGRLISPGNVFPYSVYPLRTAIMYDLEEKINFSVFPGHQGGPHNHTITALAVALGQALKPEFKEYAHQVVKNAKVLEEEFKKRGYDLASGGTGILT